MENMDKGLIVPKWVLIVWSKMPQNLSAQFVCPSPKEPDFNEKGFIGRPYSLLTANAAAPKHAVIPIHMYTRVYNLCPFYTIKPLFSLGNTFKICVLWLIKCIYKLAAINMYTCVHKYIVYLSFAPYNPKNNIWSYKNKDRAITSFKIYHLNPHILHILGFKSRFFKENLAHINMQVSNRSVNHRL